MVARGSSDDKQKAAVVGDVDGAAPTFAGTRAQSCESGDRLALPPPPWGEPFAIIGPTGEVAWRILFGRVESLEALGFKDTGSYNIGGSVATAGGLLFIGATQDKRFHAYDSKSGKLLWGAMLPDHAQR